MTNLRQIADGVWYQPADRTFDQPCLYAVVGERKTLMIDGGVTPALAGMFAGELRALTGRGVDYVAVTHWHWDHTFGLAGVDAQVIACANTAQHIARMASYQSWSDEALDERVRSGEEISFCAEYIKKTYPDQSRNNIVIRKPDLVFDGSVTLDLGGLTCELTPLPKVHTDDCVAIYVPQLQLLFLGDSTGQNSYEQPAHYAAPAVLELFRKIEAIDARLIMESHGEPANPREFFSDNRILIDAANGVLAGKCDKVSLLEHLKAQSADGLPEDAEEVVELFLNGIGR